MKIEYIIFLALSIIVGSQLLMNNTNVLGVKIVSKEKKTELGDFPTPQLSTGYKQLSKNLVNNPLYNKKSKPINDDINITAPTGYEVSLDSLINYGPSIVLNQIIGNVSETKVYVRLTSSASNGASGNIVCSSVGASTINIITGSAAAIGKELTENPIVKKISFTGSTEVGKVLLKQSASTVKKVSMELGGHAPFVVFDDADLDEAVTGAMQSKFRNSGQTCICANRIFVHEKVYDEFLNKFINEVNKIKVGNGLEEGIVSGPLIDQPSLMKVHDQVKDAVNQGAKIAVGGDVGHRDHVSVDIKHGDHSYCTSNRVGTWKDD
mgnify:CR=1 FL=1